MLNSSSLKPVTPKKYPKMYNWCIFPAEHDTGFNFPLIGTRKGGKFKEPENRKTVVNKTLVGLGASTRRQNLFFFNTLQNGNWCTRYFSTLFFSTSSFVIFPQYSAFSGFALHGNLVLSSDLVSSSNFTSIIVMRKFLNFFSFLYNRGNTRFWFNKNVCEIWVKSKRVGFRDLSLDVEWFQHVFIKKINKKDERKIHSVGQDHSRS